MNTLKNVQVDENIALGDFETKPREWLTARAREIGATYFWGYAENGALWGRFDDAGLKLSGDVFQEFQIALTPTTLQQARVFGANGELFLWRAGNEWRACVIRDLQGEQDCIPRRYWLWGTPHTDENTKQIVAQDGFTLFVEGAQGMRHTPPRADFQVNQRAALQVKHYVAYDEEGQAYVAVSRLVDVIAITAGGAQ